MLFTGYALTVVWMTGGYMCTIVCIPPGTGMVLLVMLEWGRIYRVIRLHLW